ncbi:transposase [Mycoplasma sp. 6243]|uniref:transposase n=1 Tax=Mycoplasma sp. 6243 TaxID=3440865 RepID=UPI003EBC0474
MVIIQEALDTPIGKALLNVPRDRAGRIKSKLFTRYSRRSDNLTQMIMSFCKLGGSYKEITDFIENSTDIKMSRQTISNIFTTTKEKVDEFQNRKPTKEISSNFSWFYLLFHQTRKLCKGSL